MKKVLLFLVSIFLICGCSQNNHTQKTEKDNMEAVISDYEKDLNEFVLQEGYKYEEINNLKDFQVVDKEYSNKVLERFNKIQGYVYKETGYENFIAEKWVESTPLYSISIIKDKDYFEGNKKKYGYSDGYDLCEFIGYIILPCYYIKSEGLEGNYGIEERDLQRKYVKQFGGLSGGNGAFLLDFDTKFDFSNHYKTEGFIKEMKDFGFMTHEIIPSLYEDKADNFYYLTDQEIDNYISNKVIKMVDNRETENNTNKYRELPDTYYYFDGGNNNEN